jgi:ribulose 1,5-bisphosphate synthetase/thiazole synthase
MDRTLPAITRSGTASRDLVTGDGVMTSQVIVEGSGPTGLALAAELALAGVTVRVLEK